MFKLFRQLVFVFLIFFSVVSFAATSVDAARIWPANEYTRLTLESKEKIHYKHFTIASPNRLVLDLEHVNKNDVLADLGKLISEKDPYIASVRIGYFKPEVLRIVLDLKTEVKPQVFELEPVGDYGHRLVLDIYPSKAADSATVFLAQEKETGSKVEKIEPIPPSNKPDPELVEIEKEKQNNATTPNKKGRKFVIAVDAGHGGEDPGAKGSISYEKNITLTIAQKVKELLDKQPNMRGFLVRDGDYFIPLGQRVARARKAKADLFVSIHADAFIRPDANGSSVFALSEKGATSTAARWLAKRENEADLIGGVNIAVDDPHLARTLLDLSQTATINDSIKVANAVLKQLGKINRLHGNGHVEQASFAVLKAPDIPSILVETAFISNPDEERRLNDESYQNKMAQSIVTGIVHYFENNPSFSQQKYVQR